MSIPKHWTDPKWQETLFKLHKDMLDEMSDDHEMKEKELDEFFQYHRNAEVSDRASDFQDRADDKGECET